MLQRESLFGRTPPKSPTEIAKPPVAAVAPPARTDTGTVPVSQNDNRPAAAEPVRGDPAHGNKLIVGPNIRMKGVEINDCDTLVVEGHIEATIDSRLIQIAPNGSYTGTAAIDTAEIHGAFSGEITVRKRLTVHAAGKVAGKIKYSQLVIEEGGEISGEITRLAEPEKNVRNPAVTTAAAKAVLPSVPAVAAYHR